ncbi:hypothetical protein CCR75_007226 [Bremia lactucae]|uniref:Crinkler effector protein N-terminal domain-containing protein n=1 Tax=Bremia lactucae TaxID=4779 RepID=A0A976IGL2_BRELC|nr:hypothetical protein CCR75_007226 [Bremia lactucae]
MKLLCAIVGERSVFPVTIDETKSVVALKDVVKIKNSNKIKCDAAELELYLARKGNAWLSDSEPSAQQLIKGNVDDDIESMLDCKPLMSTRSIQRYLNENHLPAPQPRQIHVLVVVPRQILSISRNSKTAKTVERYETLSKTLASQQQVESLSKAIRSILESKDEVIPFVVLESSSGMGKTQMAFNLNATGQFDVYHIMCDNVDDKGQDISAAYASRSRVFENCLKKDFEMTNGPNTGSIMLLQGENYLSLYGFIYAALLEKNELETAVWTRNDVKQALKDRVTNEKKPFIFFLDDFPREIDRKAASNDRWAYDNRRRLRLMLNVFRSFGLVVVVSSTSGTARSLTSVSSGSRCPADYLWCIVHPLLPRTVIGSDVQILPTVFQNIVSNSRPLFAEIAIQYIRENPWNVGINTANYLNALVGHLAPLLARRKQRRHHEFEIGQLCLLLCSSCRVEDGKLNLIDSHYACLDEKRTFRLFLKANGNSYKADETTYNFEDRRSWKCRSVFPHPSSDVLLYLTLTGGLSYRPFNHSLREVFLSVPSTTMYLHDTNEPMNEKQRFQVLVFAAVVLASHVDGLGGVAFPTFLGRLLYELGVKSQDVKIDFPVGFETRGNWVVPFLSPPNVKWPAWLLNDELKLDNFVQTANSETIDFRIDSGLISGECNDEEQPLSLETIRKILSRVPAESKVHLVLTRGLQKEYFTREETYAAFVREHNLATMDVYRVSCDSTLEEIVGMENQELHKVQCMDDGSTKHCEKKLVIFVEIGNGRI